MSTPTSKKEADSCGSSSSSNSSSNSSSSQDAACNSRILSSKRVGDYIYQLVGYLKTDGVQSPGPETNMKPQTKESSDQPPTQRQQKARKSFSPQFKVPPHLLGRTADNPEADAVYGKKLQKPRPGVKVPSLNLTSQILSKEELCQEVLQRTVKKQQTPVVQTLKPELARTLSNKLAHKISEGTGAASVVPHSNSPQSPQSSSTNLPADETAIEVVIIEDGEGMKSSDETPVTPTAGSGPGILSAVKRKSLLDLMKKEYVSGLNLSTKSASSQGSEDVSQSILTPPLEASNGSESISTSDSTVKIKEKVDDSVAPIVNITAEESSQSRISDEVSSITEKEGQLPEEGNSKPASPINHVDNLSCSTLPRESRADLEHADGESSETRDPLVADSDVMDVEAAMAALHGEALESDANFPEAAAEDGMEETNDSQPGHSLGDPVIVDVRSIKAEPARKKRRRGGRQSVVAKAKTTQVMKTTSKSRPSRRELDRLFIDEGAINMLCDMEKRGLAGRRSGSSSERTTLIPKDLLNHKTLQKIRSTRLQRRKWEPVTDFKRRRGAKEASEITQQEVFRHWQAFKTLSGGSAEEVVYVPRQFANPADASQIIRRRSCSSESSTDPNSDDKKRAKKRKEGSSLAITITAHQSTLHEQGHMNTRQHGTESEVNSRVFDSGSGSHDQCGDYQEFSVRLKDNFAHVVFSPRSSILLHSFNAAMLVELTSFLRQLKENQLISVVLFTSSGPSFCTGLDFPALVDDNPAARQDLANRMSLLINEFITELANCDKLLVAGLNGSVLGIGVTMLPYFDVVYASDKAVFHLPYAKLGQGTEGAVALTFRDQMTSRAFVSSLFYEGRYLTAMEVEQRGLVDSVLWPACFQEDLIARVVKLAAQATPSMLSTKKLMRASLRRELASHLEEESRLLVQSWTSDDFQRRARHLLASGELLA